MQTKEKQQQITNSMSTHKHVAQYTTQKTEILLDLFRLHHTDSQYMIQQKLCMIMQTWLCLICIIIYYYILIYIKICLEKREQFIFGEQT